MGVLELLTETARPELDYTRLEALVKRDAGLSYKLLRYLNSAAFGFRLPISSVPPTRCCSSATTGAQAGSACWPAGLPAAVREPAGHVVGSRQASASRLRRQRGIGDSRRTCSPSACSRAWRHCGRALRPDCGRRIVEAGGGPRCVAGSRCKTVTAFAGLPSGVLLRAGGLEESGPLSQRSEPGRDRGARNLLPGGGVGRAVRDVLAGC